MRPTTQIIRETFGADRYQVGWEAFAFYLQDAPSPVDADFLRLNLPQLWQTIERKELDREWLLTFSERDDVCRAAANFASGIVTANPSS